MTDRDTNATIERAYREAYGIVLATLVRFLGGDFDAAVVDYQLGLDPDVSPLLLSSQAAPNGSARSASATV